MCINLTSSYNIASFLFFGIILITICTGTVIADDIGYQIVGNMKISPLLEEEVPVDDGTEITSIEGWGTLKIWRQALITRLSVLFDGTILQDILICLSPVFFALLGLLCIFRWSSNKKKNQSPLPGDIRSHIKAHPGCTQKQLIEALSCSRGSVCYHLDKMVIAKNISRVYVSKIPHYYPTTADEDATNPIEQAIQNFSSRKKAGVALQAIYENPASTRKELAGLLAISPTTARWYITQFTEKNLLTSEKDGAEYRYSLTEEAAQIYELLMKGPSDDPAPQEKI